jgi:hypothetical protein
MTFYGLLCAIGLLVFTRWVFGIAAALFGWDTYK